jgi:UDP-N-acetylmuramate: L-alanyl-gamma-D-glutamyl-meso-diaminopimelate ligase
LVNGDDPNIAALLPAPWTQVLRVGVGEDNDLQITNFQDAPEGAQFDLVWKDEHWAHVAWPQHGLFNARNAAMAALSAALASDHQDPRDFGLSTLADFQGVRRRQDVLHSDDSWTIVEDFAHHPTAVAEAIEALRAAYPDRKMTVCFEPRSNTAASARFQTEFQTALSGADRVYLGAVHRADSMRPEERLDTSMMANALPDAKAFDDNQSLLKTLKMCVSDEAHGLIVFLTNGSFDGLPHSLADTCSSLR